MIVRLLLSLMALFSAAGVAAADSTPLPGDSLYHLDVVLTDQDGRDVQLADLRGQPVLVSMFYTSCRYICPLIIDSARGVEQALDEGERAGLRVVLVSMDPDRDDVAALKRISDRRRLDTRRWSLARTDAQSVRRRRLWIVVVGLLFFGAGGSSFVNDSSRYSEDNIQNDAFPNSMQRVGR